MIFWVKGIEVYELFFRLTIRSMKSKTFISILLFPTIIYCGFFITEQHNIQQVLHTFDEASILQCVHRCKRIDKEAAILYVGNKCQCLKYSESGNAKGTTSARVLSQV